MHATRVYIVMSSVSNYMVTMHKASSIHLTIDRKVMSVAWYLLLSQTLQPERWVCVSGARAIHEKANAHMKGWVSKP